MNLGIGDAMNLGWKLAAVLAGHGRPELLESYEPERRSVAETILRNADRGFELEASDSRLLALTRRTVLPLAVPVLARLSPAQHMIFRLFSQTWIRYRSSDAVTQQPPIGHGLRAGDRIPPDLLEVSGCPGGIRHQPLLVTGEQPGHDRASALEHLVRQYVPAGAVVTVALDTPAGRRLAGSGAARIILARPDGHAGYVGPADDLEPLRAYLTRWYHPPARPDPPA
jgi:hypothetical protein